ncbi:neuronal pentraxin receptor-like [Lingula anatina]|uniref:Neuronal pentraxin receptor-like n=1 Tax=Lingula anatina TaxID=7574 RepID=A0A1S3IRV0_LINAN|nr:neuronal pentraxin receptor-like [Lingula anatina]|eukprot:XP_013400932.1 neuronal pentraxin receptor-like [Lingula anatina]
MFGHFLLAALALSYRFGSGSGNPPPGGARVLHFPEPDSTLSWSLLHTSTPDLNAFTACIWIKTIRTTSGPILSYGSESCRRSIELGYSPVGHGYSVVLKDVSVLDRNSRAEAPLPADGNWHHWCVVWSVAKREINMYRDGLHTLSRPVNVTLIPGGGKWVVGHTHYETTPDCPPKHPSFVGFVGGVNVWDHDKVDIPGLAICANTNEGSLISWDTVTKTNFKVATYKEYC